VPPRAQALGETDFKKHNLEFYSLFKHSNFKEYIDKKIMEKKKIYENKQTKKLEPQSIPL
jgi:hypothetical protein